jgi:hypothetical protein
MANPRRTPEQLWCALVSYALAGEDASAAARAQGMAPRTMQDAVKEAKARLSAPSDHSLEETRLAQQLKEVRAVNDGLRKELLTGDAVQEVLNGMVGPVGRETAPWVSRGAKKGRRREGVLVADLSDLHYGEIVHPEQMDGVNAYNPAIARRRITRAVELIPYLGKEHSGDDWAGVALLLGGDLINGIIHTELREGSAPVTHDLIEIFDLLRSAITFLADEFGKVQVFSVVGNHGRLDAKEYKRAKFRQDLNFEWLLVQFLNRALASDPRISFQQAKGNSLFAQILDTNIVMVHGDEVRGGGGWGGIMSPIRRLVGGIKQGEMTINRRVDYVFIHHWHQLWMGADMVVNGCSKGFDEYAKRLLLDPQTPRQFLGGIFPDLGMTMARPLLLDGTDKVPQGKDWEFFEKGPK